MDEETSNPDLRTEVDAAARRRAPLQIRSQQTVQRVLDAASALLQRTSLEEITTTRIADEAGLSIGALYRFFPDKQSIIDAIAVRHVERFRSEVATTVLKTIAGELVTRAKVDPAIVLDAVIDAYVVYLDAHPDFRAISFGRHISAATKEREVSTDVGLPGLLKKFLVRRLGMADSSELDLRLRVVSEAGEHLIAYAYEQNAREERDRIVAEMKRMLARYLFS